MIVLGGMSKILLLGVVLGKEWSNASVATTDKIMVTKSAAVKVNDRVKKSMLL
jgi:hypothetical protein